MSFKVSGTSGDAGLEAEASGPGALLEDLALGLYAMSSGDGGIRPETVRRVSLSADTPQSLIVNFLNELVFLMDTEGFVAAGVRADAELSGVCRVEAELRGETAAFERRSRGLLVKAATYHGLEVEEMDGRWRARVVLDL